MRTAGQRDALPILHENRMLEGEFGRYIFAAGAVGEVFPVLAIALFLTQGSHFAAILSVLAVGLLAVALSAVPFLARSERLKTIIEQGKNATSQIVLRWSVVLLFLLLVIASRFGLDVVLGAMLAGMVLRGWTRAAGRADAARQRRRAGRRGRPVGAGLPGRGGRAGPHEPVSPGEAGGQSRAASMRSQRDDGDGAR